MSNLSPSGMPSNRGTTTLIMLYNSLTRRGCGSTPEKSPEESSRSCAGSNGKPIEVGSRWCGAFYLSSMMPKGQRDV